MVGCALPLAVVVPLSVEWIKTALNFSGHLKKDFNFNVKSNALQVVALLAIASTLHYTDATENFSPLGYDSPIIGLGIGLKWLLDYFSTAYYYEEDVSASNVSVGLLQPKHSASIYAGQWYNWPAMHFGARFLLLFCATNAGGKFIEGANIPLEDFLTYCGLKNFIAIVAFSVLLNEIIGPHLFKWSGQFKEVHPNVISRVLTMIGLAVGLQLINQLQAITQVNFLVGFLIGFGTDLLVQESGLGPKIDRTVEDVASSLKAKCCTWQPAGSRDSVAYQAVRNPMLSNV